MKLCECKFNHKVSLFTTVAMIFGLSGLLVVLNRSMGGLDMPPVFHWGLVAWYGLCAWNITDDVLKMKRGAK